MVNLTIVARCVEWVRSTLGEGILTDRRERAMRVLEEATELAQAEGIGLAQATGIMHRVYSRPAGDPCQEMAGVQFTLVVYAWARGFGIERALIEELERVEDPALVERIRAKHEEKVALGIGRPR